MLCQVNYKLNQLFVNFPDRVRVALLEKILKCKRHIIVVNFDDSRLIVLQIRKVDDVFVVNSF